MSEKRPSPLYLERQSYLRRRMVDAARLLPLVGLAFFLLPLLSVNDDLEPPSTARIGLFIFAIWGGLIIVAGWLSSKLDDESATKDEAEK